MASNTLIVNGKEYDACPLDVENWTAGGGEIDYKFKNQTRAKFPITEIIVHETVTCSSLATIKVLEPPTPGYPYGRNLGVHFVVDPSGKVYQHGDLATDFLWHASQHNPLSIGIETVNPVATAYAPKTNSPWQNTIKAPWCGQKDGLYVVPTPEQSEAVCQILKWCLNSPAPEISVPVAWRGLGNGKMALSRVKGTEHAPGPGIYAHHYFEHGDGAWLVLYSWLRLTAGLDAATAYQEAMKRATGVPLGGGADVSDLLAGFDPAVSPNFGSVVQVQMELIAEGYDLGASGADGIEGNMTKAAISKFQDAHGLPRTGVVDPSTASAMLDEYKKRNQNGG